MQHPAICPTVRVALVNDGCLAYDEEHDHVHWLNLTAALILEQCDGTRDVVEIERSVHSLLGPAHSAAVTEWLAGAEADGLVYDAPTGVPSSGDPALPLEADELTALAARLREEGQIDEAYLCQQAAARLNPDDSEIWRELGELAHIAGQREAARAAYERYISLAPDDVEVRHILTALSDQPPPDRASDECIQQLYARFSTFYDTNMRDELEYQAPEELLSALTPHLPAAESQLRVLDLGCGTGLVGELLRPWANELTGVDLSPEMIEHARRREIYDRLEVAEITRWLSSSSESFDLMVACDTLIYFGELGQVFAAAVTRLASGGLLGITVERGDESPFSLTDSGRYCHTSSYLQQVATENGLTPVSERESLLRQEYGEPTMGLVAVFRSA